ncbi:hypothetical protein J4E81_007516 [Alternaria sp. BMP 2799]|nr:hypothetical protein J4E81_007516 [Alternaria sp. BMP 2799]
MSTTQTVSTTTILGPIYSPQPTLLRDCPSANNTLRTVTHDNASYSFRKLCNGSYLNIRGVTAHVQGIVKSLDECIDRCVQHNQDNRADIQAGKDPLCNTRWSKPSNWTIELAQTEAKLHDVVIERPKAYARLME